MDVKDLELISATYRKIMKVNLTTDTYEMIKTDPEETIPEHAKSSLTDFNEWFASTGNIYGNDLERFEDFINVDNLRKHLSDNNHVTVTSYRRKTEQGFRWNTVEIIPAHDYSDDNQTVLICVKDVHERHQEGFALEESQIHHQEIIHALGELNFGIYLVDLQTGILNPVRTSPDVDKLLQSGIRTWEEVLAQTLSLFHPECREEMLDKYSFEALKKSMLAGKEKSKLLCQRMLEGNYHYVTVTAYFHETQEEKKYAILAIQDVDDATRQQIHRSQQQIEYDKEKQESSEIINSLSSLFFSTYYMDIPSDTLQTITQQDDVCEIIGDKTDMTDVIDTYAEHFVHPDYREEYRATINKENFLKNLSEEHPFVAVEYRRIRKTDDDFENYGWVRATVIMTEEKDGKPVKAIYVGQDITESKRREEQEQLALKEAFESAMHANASKSEFLSRMSHDIRTPMNAIIGMTSIATNHLDNPDRVKDCLNKITVSSKHLLSLINEVLDMSKIESGKINLAEEEFTLSDLIESLLTMIRPTTQAKNQHLKFNIGNIEHEDLIGDVMRLQQVFMNILGNAVKYTPEGGDLEVSISEKVSKSYGYGCYEFIFRDSGIGMSEEYIKQIFEPFSRAEDSRVSKIEGTGLGMTIALNIVHMMNGSIQVESEPGKGSQFTVTVFLKQQDTNLPDVEQFANLPVLVVDDDEVACETTCELLESLGMRSEGVLNGKDAIDRVVKAHDSGEDFFAVILDWKMPEMDGVETTEAIRKVIGPDLPIIILSAYDWSTIEAEARQVGVNGFISKPLFKSRLVYLFKKVASGKQIEDPKQPEDSYEELFQGKRILLVEDNDLNREIAIEIIGDTGIQIESVADGKQAVDKYLEMGPNYYDLIFMDIQMPVMNGYQATEAIRNTDQADAKSIPIIAMTANAFVEDVIASKNAGMNEHVTKPLQIEELIACIKRWI